MKLLLLTLISVQVLALDCTKYKRDISEIKSCSDKSVHLTFDDGPNTSTTPKVIKSLKRQNVKATFFISTHQLEKGDLKKKKEILTSMLNSGHTIASHGHDHNCHDIRYDWNGNLQSGYDDAQRREQVSKSNELLGEFSNGQFSKQKYKLIRFPYGRGISPSPKEIEKMIKDGRDIRGSSYAQKLSYYRKHSPAMSIASEYDLSHVGWNHDSKDSTAQYSAANKDEYIKLQVKSFCNSTAKNIMTLYHDTRKINSLPSKYDSSKTVLDEIIEKGKCLGVKFTSIDEILSAPLQEGVYTQSYGSTQKLEKVVQEINDIKVAKTTSCNEVQKINSQAESCYSDYIGDVKHCHGNESFCIDGSWIKNKKLYKATCYGSIDSETAKLLSSQYIQKSCEKASEAVELGSAKCYCQFKGENLVWNCYDISSGTAKSLN